VKVGTRLGISEDALKQDSDFCQKYDFSLQFFNRSFAKSRRTAKRPTVLNSLLNMLTILITFKKNYFLKKLFHFL